MWFKGSTTDALAECRNKKALLVVFYNSDNDESKRITELWGSEIISNACKNKNILSIIIDSNSIDGKQFADVYPIFSIPSIFMISGHTALEVILTFDQVTEAMIVEKLTITYEKHMTLLNEQDVLLNEQSKKLAIEVEEDKQKPEMKQNEPGPSTVEKVDPSQSNEKTSTSQEVCSELSGLTSFSAAPLVEEGSETTVGATQRGDGTEVVERAKELVKMQQDKKIAEEKKNFKKSELDRRQMGKDMQEFKDRQKLEQMREDAEQWKKEKKEDLIAKEKIKAQILQDRADRAAKYSTEKSLQKKISEDKIKKTAEEKDAAQIIADENRMKNAIIQFRLIDGSSIKQSFSSSQNFSEVVDFITKRLCNKNLRLSTNFPRKEFTDEDSTRTLLELELAPQSTIHAVPADRPMNVISSNQNNSFMHLLLSPFTYLWSWIQYLLFTPKPPASSAKGHTDNVQSTPNKKPMESNLEKKRFGNITSFRSKVSDDTDNATDNGNSSQQL